MTIAACYVSPEGVVLGADSTVSYMAPGRGFQHFNNNQKIFEVGSPGVVGVATWGLGSFGTDLSIRTALAEFADLLENRPQKNMAEVAKEWAKFVWGKYNSYISNSPELSTFRALKSKASHDSNNPTSRSPDEDRAFQELSQNLAIGFYIGGRGGSDRNPGAYRVEMTPNQAAVSNPQKIDVGVLSWAGIPNIASRVVRGYDENLRKQLLDSKQWTGSEKELDHILNQQSLSPGIVLPIRDAIDYVYSCIFGTIKAMKFSQLPSVCGGTIEVAVVTSDRDFRWVKHKAWSTGIDEVF